MEVNIDYVPQPKQMELHTCAGNEILFGGAAGPGKVVIDTAKVLTPWGWRQGKDLKEGDILLNPDGTRQQIIAISDPITAPGYTVKLQDGSETTVMQGHLWLSWRSGKRKKSVIADHFGNSSAKIITTETLQKWAKTAKEQQGSGSRPNWPLIPICKPLHFERVANRYKKIDIDPYLLGVLLGDGHISNGQIAITSIDHAHMEEVLHGYNYVISDKPGTDAKQYSFRGDTYRSLREQLEKVGLYGKLSNEKEIPAQYLYGSIKERLSVLQGLMDTDGTVDHRGGWASFCSVSQLLADGVRHLVFSLGGTANITSRVPFYTDSSGERVPGQLAHNVYIKFPNNTKLFRLPRKSALAAKCPDTPMNRRVVDVTVGKDVTGRCITVDNPNGLYITDNFIVTHNSHALRFEGLIWCLRVPGIQVYLFRRTFPELEKNHILPSQDQFPRNVCEYKKGDKRWEFVNGSMLHFCHCQYEQDVFQYQGAEIHLLLIDELTTFTEFQYDYLRSRVRTTLPIEKKYRHKIPGVACATNPGGVGHEFAKRRWVDYAPPFKLRRADSKEGGMLRCYIPGLLSDNQVLMQTDPEYIHRLDALPEPYRTAYKDGRWDIFMGQAFNFTREHHVISPLPIPYHAPVYMTYDWGFGAPFSIGWWWVDADNRIYRFAEWYGWNGEPNKGLRIEDSLVAEGIRDRESRMEIDLKQIRARYAGPDCFQKKPDYKGGGQGPSTAETFAQHKLYLTPGDAKRELKIRQFRERLKIPDDAPPMMLVYDTCDQFIRTVPMIQTDPKNVEYVDEKGELHGFDDACHLCMARPMSLQEVKSRKTMADLRIDMLEKGDHHAQADWALAQEGQKLDEEFRRGYHDMYGYPEVRVTDYDQYQQHDYVQTVED